MADTKNIYLKLARARAALRLKALIPTGKNTFTKFNYFELGDFLPAALDALDVEGLTPVINYGADTATLTISDGEECIVFSTPTAPVEMKSCQPIQSLGAQQSYLRRYLYLTAMEITEHDALDENAGGPLLKTDDGPAKKEPAPKDEANNGNVAQTILKAYTGFDRNIKMSDLERIAGKKHGEWQEPEVGRLRVKLQQIKKEVSNEHHLGD